MIKQPRPKAQAPPPDELAPLLKDNLNQQTLSATAEYIVGEDVGLNFGGVIPVIPTRELF